MIEEILNWLEVNLANIIITIVTIGVGLVVYKLISRQLRKYASKGKIDEELSKNIKKIFKFLIILVVVSVILSLFTEALGLVTSLFTLVGGTIFGFAAINTLGNAVAGLILMVSKPFKKGDRIQYGERVADVLEVQFMHTKLRLLNKTLISIPNLTLMEESIINFSQDTPLIGRNVVITVDYEANPDEIIAFLEETVTSIEGIAQDPKPNAVVSALGDYAVEYTTLYKVSDPTTMFKIDNAVRLAVLKKCQEKGIDLSMPMMVKTL